LGREVPIDAGRGKGMHGDLKLAELDPMLIQVGIVVSIP
jgi:hypothetical protein